MRKPSLALSLKRIVILSILAACLGAYEAAAACPPTTAGKPASLPAQPCQKWTYGVDTNNPSKYLALFPNNCDNSYGVLTCYWNSAHAACKAHVKDRDEDSNLTWTFMNVVPTQDPKIKRCKYKIDRSVYDDLTVQFDNVHFMPYQAHCEIEINGPYRTCSDNFTLCGTPYTEAQRGFEFTSSQKNKIKALNKDRHNDKLGSDLAGYRYPKPANENCVQPDPGDPSMCVEPAILSETPYQPSSAEIHHVIPKKDRQGCACGKNSMANAVVISRQLNRYFLNFKRPADEVATVNEAGQNDPYVCSSQAAPPLTSSPSAKIGRPKVD
jgi:hypothetical protein